MHWRKFLGPWSVSIFALGAISLSAQAQLHPYPEDRPLSSISIPSKPKPPYLAYHIDPSLNTYIRRISDQGIFSSSVSLMAHQYSTRQAWNADGTRLLLAATHPGWLLDGNSYELIRPINQPNDAQWSNTNASLIYGIGYNGGQHNQLVTMDTANGDAISVKFTFTGLQDMGIGPYEGNLSNDDRYVALHGTRSGQSRIITFDTTTSSVIAEIGVGPSFDFAKISQDGNWVVTGHTAAGSNQVSGINVYSRNLVFQRHLTDVSEHGDMGVDSNGNQVWVQYASDDASVAMWRLSDGGRTTLLPSGSSGVWGGHLSCRNLDRPGWCYLSDNGWDFNSLYWLGNDEILAIKLDASQQVERFAHMHHSHDAGYEHQTMGSPDRSGRRVIFRSDWGLGSTAEVNSYVAYNNSLVGNGGFEFGLDGWPQFTGGSWQIETVDVFEGARSLRVTSGGGSSAFWNGDISPGKTYRLSVVARCPDGQGSVFAQFFDDDYVLLSQKAIPITSGNYGYSQLLFNPPIGATRLRASVWKNPGTSDLFVDQLMLSEW